jgi:hypothetical protein
MGREPCFLVASDTTAVARGHTTAAGHRTVIISENTTVVCLATPSQTMRRACSAL